MKAFTAILSGLVGLCLMLTVHWAFWVFVTWDVDWLLVIPDWNSSERFIFLVFYVAPISVIGIILGVGAIWELAREN